jgi:pyruvyl transferase EpsO
MTDKQSSRDVIARLQGVITDCLSPFIDHRAFALLDFPDHSNVGDSAIFLGEMAFFNKLGRSPRYVCVHNRVNWQTLGRTVADGPILLHGGGNFGDLWPQHHTFRLDILRRYPERQIIQLPQSIHFENDDNIAETREAIATHGAFVLTVRDQESFDFAKTHFDCNVILCPDMAFCIGPQLRRRRPVYDEIYLLRTDKERIVADRPVALSNSITTDWLQSSKYLERQIRLERKLFRMLGSLFADKSKLDNLYFNTAAHQRIEKGFRILSAGRHVTSDRLHVHILCTLLDIPHTVLDNNYGKITRFMRTWDTVWSGVTNGSAEHAII